MPVTELLEPVVGDGIRLTHFFNGRILTAEDLQREQDAGRAQHRQLARAVGEGVVHGLEVRAVQTSVPASAPQTEPAPLLRIEPGLAFNRDGDAVALPRAVDLRLVPASEEADADAGLFAVCQASTATIDLTNPGLYLLSARPASALSTDRVSAVDLGSDGVGNRCGSRYAEEGASFTLVPLPLAPSGGTATGIAAELKTLLDTIDSDVNQYKRNLPSVDATLELKLAKEISKLRNGAAYFCLGADRQGSRILGLAPRASTASALPALSPLEELRTSGALAGCDVPIALLYISQRRLEFVDMWAVRRVPTPALSSDAQAIVAGGRDRAEAAAAFFQFREHASVFLEDSPPLAPERVVARDWFLFLPAAGVLPIKAGTERGFDRDTFFDWVFPPTSPPTLPANVPTVPKAWAVPLVSAALGDVPMYLSATPRPRPRLYRLASDAGETGFENRWLLFAHDSVR